VCASVTAKRVSEKNPNDRQSEPTAQPLGGHVGSAAGDLYPLDVGCEYRDQEVC
jgi:hypothetical protein